MKTLFTETEFKNAKSSDSLLCECEQCHNPFGVEKKLITYELKNNRNRHKFCSDKCFYSSKEKTHTFNCPICNSEFQRKNSQVVKNKTNNFFCSQSCSAIHHNKNKTHGNRRSKLEIWIENELTIKYPNLKIDYNRKDAVGSELDIYIPSLNLAFELNGIFHYEPIYGDKKFTQIKNNDKLKAKLCLENNIELHIIDISEQKNMTVETSIKYLDIITNVVKERF